MSSPPSTQEYDSEYNSNNMNNESVEVNEYIRSLPLDTININVSGRNLKRLPDLSKFTQLQELHCHHNNLRELLRLPHTLLILNCGDNEISELPELSRFTQLQQLSLIHI